MSSSVGVIAEDTSDVDVIKVLIDRLIRRDRFKVVHFVGHGCGKIMGKCRQWARHLARRGCTRLIVIRDLDRNKVQTLRQELTASLEPSPQERSPIRPFVIIIPVRAIEAWLLSDVAAIRRAMRLRSAPKEISNPELEPNPKKRLGEIVYCHSGKTKRYLNTVHNTVIAPHLDLPKLRRCRSFLPFEQFVSDYL